MFLLVDKLKQYFEVYGDVQDAVVMKDPVSRRSRGFGFITFNELSSVENVLNAFITSASSSHIINESIGHAIDGRKVEVKRAVPRTSYGNNDSHASSSANKNAKTSSTVSKKSSKDKEHSYRDHQATTEASTIETDREKEKSVKAAKTTSSSASASSAEYTSNNVLHGNDYAYNKIFVGGLHYDTRDPEFRSYFEQYGTIITSEVMFNRETHKSRGFGFVVYEIEKSAENVCNVTEHVIDGRVVSLAYLKKYIFKK